MELNKSSDGLVRAPRLRQLLPIAACAGQVVADRLAVAAGVVSRVVAGDSSHPFATHHRGLFIGKGHHFQGVAQADGLILEAADHFQPSQHSKGSVKAAAGGHGVEMGSRHQSGQARFCAFNAANQIASRINANAGSSGDQPLAEQGAGSAVVLCEGQTLDGAVALQADGGHGVQTCAQARLINRCCPTGCLE